MRQRFVLGLEPLNKFACLSVLGRPFFGVSDSCCVVGKVRNGSCFHVTIRKGRRSRLRRLRQAVASYVRGWCLLWCYRHGGALRELPILPRATSTVAISTFAKNEVYS